MEEYYVLEYIVPVKGLLSKTDDMIGTQINKSCENTYKKCKSKIDKTHNESKNNIFKKFLLRLSQKTDSFAKNSIFTNDYLKSITEYSGNNKVELFATIDEIKARYEDLSEKKKLETSVILTIFDFPEG